jgi:hypothetical protein
MPMKPIASACGAGFNPYPPRRAPDGQIRPR